MNHDLQSTQRAVAAAALTRQLQDLRESGALTAGQWAVMSGLLQTLGSDADSATPGIENGTSLRDEGGGPDEDANSTRATVRADSRVRRVRWGSSASMAENHTFTHHSASSDDAEELKSSSELRERRPRAAKPRSDRSSQPVSGPTSVSATAGDTSSDAGPNVGASTRRHLHTAPAMPRIPSRTSIMSLDPAASDAAERDADTDAHRHGHAQARGDADDAAVGSAHGASMASAPAAAADAEDDDEEDEEDDDARSSAVVLGDHKRSSRVASSFTNADVATLASNLLQRGGSTDAQDQDLDAAEAAHEVVPEDVGDADVSGDVVAPKFSTSSGTSPAPRMLLLPGSGVTRSTSNPSSASVATAVQKGAEHLSHSGPAAVAALEHSESGARVFDSASVVGSTSALAGVDEEEEDAAAARRRQSARPATSAATQQRFSNTDHAVASAARGHHDATADTQSARAAPPASQCSDHSTVDDMDQEDRMSPSYDAHRYRRRVDSASAGEEDEDGAMHSPRTSAAASVRAVAPPSSARFRQHARTSPTSPSSQADKHGDDEDHDMSASVARDAEEEDADKDLRSASAMAGMYRSKRRSTSSEEGERTALADDRSDTEEEDDSVHDETRAHSVMAVTSFVGRASSPMFARALPASGSSAQFAQQRDSSSQRDGDDVTVSSTRPAVAASLAPSIHSDDSTVSNEPAAALEHGLAESPLQTTTLNAYANVGRESRTHDGFSAAPADDAVGVADLDSPVQPLRRGLLPPGAHVLHTSAAIPPLGSIVSAPMSERSRVDPDADAASAMSVAMSRESLTAPGSSRPLSRPNVADDAMDALEAVEEADTSDTGQEGTVIEQLVAEHARDYDTGDADLSPHPRPDGRGDSAAARLRHGLADSSRSRRAVHSTSSSIAYRDADSTARSVHSVAVSAGTRGSIEHGQAFGADADAVMLSPLNESVYDGRLSRWSTANVSTTSHAIASRSRLHPSVQQRSRGQRDADADAVYGVDMDDDADGYDDDDGYYDDGYGYDGLSETFPGDTAGVLASSPPPEDATEAAAASFLSMDAPQLHITEDDFSVTLVAEPGKSELTVHLGSRPTSVSRSPQDALPSRTWTAYQRALRVRSIWDEAEDVKSIHMSVSQVEIDIVEDVDAAADAPAFDDDVDAVIAAYVHSSQRPAKDARPSTAKGSRKPASHQRGREAAARAWEQPSPTTPPMRGTSADLADLLHHLRVSATRSTLKSRRLWSASAAGQASRSTGAAAPRAAVTDRHDERAMYDSDLDIMVDDADLEDDGLWATSVRRPRTLSASAMAALRTAGTGEPSESSHSLANETQRMYDRIVRPVGSSRLQRALHGR